MKVNVVITFGIFGIFMSSFFQVDCSHLSKSKDTKVPVETTKPIVIKPSEYSIIYKDPITDTSVSEDVKLFTENRLRTRLDPLLVEWEKSKTEEDRARSARKIEAILKKYNAFINVKLADGKSTIFNEPPSVSEEPSSKPEEVKVSSHKSKSEYKNLMNGIGIAAVLLALLAFIYIQYTSNQEKRSIDL